MKKIILCTMATALAVVTIFAIIFYITGENYSKEWGLMTIAVLGGFIAILVCRDFTMAVAIGSIAIASIAISSAVAGGAPISTVVAGVAIVIGFSATHEEPSKTRKIFYLFLMLEMIIIIFGITLINGGGY